MVNPKIEPSSQSTIHPSIRSVFGHRTSLKCSKCQRCIYFLCDFTTLVSEQALTYPFNFLIQWILQRVRSQRIYPAVAGSFRWRRFLPGVCRWNFLFDLLLFTLPCDSIPVDLAWRGSRFWQWLFENWSQGLFVWFLVCHFIIVSSDIFLLCAANHSQIAGISRDCIAGNLIVNVVGDLKQNKFQGTTILSIFPIQVPRAIQLRCFLCVWAHSIVITILSTIWMEQKYDNTT